MITRRATLIGAAAMAAAAGTNAQAAEAPGVSAGEIKIGNTMPYSGPASAYGVLGKAEAGFFRWVNDHGGVLNWKPMFFLFYGTSSAGAVMRPAGAENSVGVLTTTALKDPTDPAWDSDAGMRDFKDFMARYVPGGDLSDSSYVAGYGAAYTMWKVLQQCDGDFSRANVMKQATNLKDLEVPVLLPGIKINTSPTNYRPIRSLQMARWSGKSWVRFGEIIEGVAA